MKEHTRWRFTGDPELSDYRCGLCGGQADSVHFFPVYRDPEADVDVVLACQDHDPGGRWYPLGKLIEPETLEKYHMLDHIEAKVWGRSACFAFYDLVDGIRHEIAMRGRGE